MTKENENETHHKSAKELKAERKALGLTRSEHDRLRWEAARAAKAAAKPEAKQ